MVADETVIVEGAGDGSMSKARAEDGHVVFDVEMPDGVGSWTAEVDWETALSFAGTLIEAAVAAQGQADGGKT